MYLEVASEVSGRGGAIYFLCFGEEAGKKLVRGHGLEGVLDSIGRRFLNRLFCLFIPKLTLVEHSLMLLHNVGA